MAKVTRNSRHGSRREGDTGFPDEAPRRANNKRAAVAPVMIGRTPEEVAAHLGALPLPPARSAPQQAQDKERLSAALRTVIGWYQDTLQGPSLPAGPAPADTSDPESLVRQFVAMRSEWERREAHLLAADMNARFRHAAEGAPGADASAMAAPPDAPAPMSAPEPAPAPRRTALLVDDTSDILVTVGAFLWSLGFDVLRASNADAAMEILADGSKVDLLVADHAMPGMTGTDLVVEASHRHPRLRAMIITGYPDTTALAQLPPGVTVLAKPFRRSDLTERVRCLFDGHAVANDRMATVRAV